MAAIASSRSSGRRRRGKSAVAEALAEPDRRRGRLGRLDAGLPRPADPDEPARAADAARRRSGRSTTRARSASTSALAHAAIDEIARAPAARRSSPAAPASTCAPRSPSSTLPPAPPPGRARALGARSTTSRAPTAAHALLAERDPEAAARVHPNDRRRVVRALELAEAGASLAPADDRLWAGETRHPTLIVGLDVPHGRARAPDRARARGRCSSAGVEDEVRRGARRPALVDGAEGHRARARSPSCRATRRSTAIVLRTRRYAAYQRKWMRRIPGLVTRRRRPPAGRDRR